MDGQMETIAISNCALSVGGNNTSIHEKNVRFFAGFYAHQHCIKLYYWRKTSCALQCISGHLSRITDVCKLAGQLPPKKESKVPGGIRIQNSEGQMILSPHL